VKLLATSAADARLALTEKYGPPPYDPPVVRNTEVDTTASPGPVVPKKVSIDERVHMTWSFERGGFIRIDELPSRRVEVFYTAPLWDESNNY
jgi:hypothetical protein